MALDLRVGRTAVRPGVLTQALHFAAIGVLSTVAYLLLYVLLRGTMSAQLANALALLVTAIANTAANRRLTFGVSGRSGVGRHQLQGLIVFAVGLVITSGSLLALHALAATPPRWIEVAVLVVANAVATLVRFVALRSWVFRSESRSRPESALS